MSNNELLVSIVIPTLDSSETLQYCLSSIKKNITEYQYEIIIVDGGSIDKTISIAKEYTTKIILKNGCLRGEARNIGISCAKGSIICFTDSDCIVPNNWIDGLVNNLKNLHNHDHKVIGVGSGNCPTIENMSLIELAISSTIRSPLVSFKARNVSNDLHSYEVLHNPPISSAYFKCILKKVDGFDETINDGEDLELDAKINDLGYKLYYISGLVVEHKHKASTKQFIKQMYQFGKARILVGFRHKQFINLHHYGPLILCLMSLSPMFIIPLMMAIVNGVYVATNERKISLASPIIIFTMIFYLSYGLGEIVQILKHTRYYMKT